MTCQIERRRPLLPRQLYSTDCCSRISANFEKKRRNRGITVNRVHTALCRDPHHLTVIPPPRSVCLVTCTVFPSNVASTAVHSISLTLVVVQLMLTKFFLWSSTETGICSSSLPFFYCPQSVWCNNYKLIWLFCTHANLQRNRCTLKSCVVDATGQCIAASQELIQHQHHHQILILSVVLNSKV